MALAAQKREGTHTFYIKVLGKMVEHLGHQMYKKRDAAIAELVANCWDAGAKNVYIKVPVEDQYKPDLSKISIRDDGSGMDADNIQNEYLVIGRDRRKGGPDMVYGRPIMGKKGVGKLAGFGVASRMTVETWKKGRLIRMTLNLADLEKDDKVVHEVPIQGKVLSPYPGLGTKGTQLILEELNHVTPIGVDQLRESLARKFSRKIRGEMIIYVNDQPLGEPSLDIEYRFPPDGSEEIIISDSAVRYYYAFSKKPIASRDLRGFTIYVRGKTAQAPPFFFDVEGTASGQHGTRYVTGAIEADFLDNGPVDLISTDRQEIDWEAAAVQEFRGWGQELCRRVLREWADRKGRQLEAWLLEDEDLRQRINALDTESQKQIKGFLRTLSKVEAENAEDTKELADALIRAFEFRQFHSVVEDLETVSDDPEKLKELLQYLNRWQVLESRAILEVVKGRLNIIDKFHGMIVNYAPETAPRTGVDNIHDLIAGYPWLLNPEWQVLSEEKSISRQLREWGEADIKDPEKRRRYDFLALSDERRIIVIDIKRPGHAVELEELQRLEGYKERLSQAHEEDLHMVMVCSGNLNVSRSVQDNWKERSDGEILEWKNVFTKARNHYEHYRAILEKLVKHPDFNKKGQEVARTREIIASGTAFRGPEVRAKGLGPQDVQYTQPQRKVRSKRERKKR